MTTTIAEMREKLDAYNGATRVLIASSSIYVEEAAERQQEAAIEFAATFAPLVEIALNNLDHIRSQLGNTTEGEAL